MKLSDVFAEKNGMITFVGAGGKSSLLRKLAAEWQEEGHPFLLTTTTKMGPEQVQEYDPVFSPDFEDGLRQVQEKLDQYGYAAWFQERTATKAVGLPVDWLDSVYCAGLVQSILAEGDGAGQKLLKAPREGEPVVSRLNETVVGVLNLGALGRRLGPDIVFRLELVAVLLGKDEGEVITPGDYVTLALHERGIFSRTYGEKLLVLTNVESADLDIAEEMIARISERPGCDIRRFLVTRGFDKQLEPVKIVG
ncbi:MAG: selenium cofactor biosynthesis protein YqeC [Clostridia bacterium]|jgi:probable selenium-dependent hydroxylase accessory protein YqeC|nr:selenium cofactor biosynthesis protein YqeC [Clostridia bacterium]